MLNLISPKIGVSEDDTNEDDIIAYYIHSFWHSTGVWRTDRQMDERTDRNAIANAALSIAARYKMSS